MSIKKPEIRAGFYDKPADVVHLTTARSQYYLDAKQLDDTLEQALDNLNAILIARRMVYGIATNVSEVFAITEEVIEQGCTWWPNQEMDTPESVRQDVKDFLIATLPAANVYGIGVNQ